MDEDVDGFVVLQFGQKSACDASGHMHFVIDTGPLL